MSNWDILGISPTSDLNIIKKAYSEKSKIYHPETHPDEFQKLHKAYKSVLSSILKYPDMHQSSDTPVVKQVTPKKTASEILETIKNDAHEDYLQMEQELVNQKAIREANLQKEAQRLKDVAFLELIDNTSKEKEIAQRKLFHMDELENMLANRYYPENWKKYFTRDEFLNNQYNPDYIKAIADAFDKRIKQPVSDTVDTVGRCPQYAFIYLVIAYGCMFDNVGTFPIEERIYKIDLLEPLQKAFRLYDSMLLSYILVEKEEHLLGERFAFYVYRNILELLDKTHVDSDDLCQWVAWGLAKENHTHILDICHYSPSHGVRVTPDKTRFHDKIKRSPVIFELFSYLLEKPSTPPVFKQVLREVCEAYLVNPHCDDEIRILHLMTE
ncbi:MAG: DnaJ domain-containing protein [Lachnospira sp.]|nr:DnaJ domain-containing protein [Lachnospira sp.]